MIKLFGSGKPDHPLADPKEAKRILDDLAAQEPLKALEELAHLLESTSSVEGYRMDNRVRLLFSLEGAAQTALRKISRDYFAPTRPTKFQENRMWVQMHEYWRQAGHGYARCIDPFLRGDKDAEGAKALLPQLLVRTLRSLAQHIKWMHLRYGPVDLAVWGVLNAVYAFAEARGLVDAKASAVQGAPGESSPRLEFLRAVIFSASAPDSLLPLEVELAERLIGAVAPGFAIAPGPRPQLAHWIDLGRAMAPQRITKPPEPSVGLRCLGIGSARDTIRNLAQKIRSTNQVPTDLNLGAGYDAEMVLEVLEHLAQNWAETPPARRHPRVPARSGLAVSYGFSSVLEMIGGASEDSLNFDTPKAAEAWQVENVSMGGFGAVVPKISGDWLKVGALLALQPEGGQKWVVGLVRRVNRTTPTEARVGIETVAKTPAVGAFSANGGAAQGIVLEGETPGEVRIAFKPGVFVPGQNLEAERGGKQHVYLPQGVAERGEDFEIARFREMVREG